LDNFKPETRIILMTVRESQEELTGGGIPWAILPARDFSRSLAYLLVGIVE